MLTAAKIRTRSNRYAVTVPCIDPKLLSFSARRLVWVYSRCERRCICRTRSDLIVRHWWASSGSRANSNLNELEVGGELSDTVVWYDSPWPFRHIRMPNAWETSNNLTQQASSNIGLTESTWSLTPFLVLRRLCWLQKTSGREKSPVESRGVITSVISLS